MDKIDEILLRLVSNEIDAITQNEIKYALDMFHSIDKSKFGGKKMSDIVVALAGSIAGKIKDRRAIKEHRDINIHEYQIAQLSGTDDNITGIPGIDDSTLMYPESPENTKDIQMESLDVVDIMGMKTLEEFKLFINPESQYQHFYLVLDSNYRNTTEEISTDIKRFTWMYTPTQNLGVGFCNSVGVIKDIVGMRMYQPRVPYVASMATSAKRVSVLIEEFAAQSFIGENGRRFHFLLRPDYLNIGNNAIELSTEDFNDGIFTFRKPITTLDSLTVSFGNPLDIISFSTPFTRFIIPFEFVCLKSDK